ncbi:MAG: cobalamin biosynthesis protein CobD [Myxococcales bacterium FL481]|nr:MAG: cobalamin biosynthesis protein CobD [Myxococcales bacterium FL481]
MDPFSTTTALLAALTIDLAWGDPPNRWHPVAWFGRVCSPLRRLANLRWPPAQLAAGILTASVAPLGFVAAGVLAIRAAEGIGWLQFVIEAAVLSCTFAIRGLGEAALRVAAALERDDLASARRHLGALCSRDAQALDAQGVAAGAIESVAENASDSAVAPLMFAVVFGLEGALFYRAVNTLDAMFGYRGPFEYFGKPMARLDDILNLIPARITAAWLCLAALGGEGSAKHGWRIWMRDAGRTPSPNAGRPMAAMAGILGVRLTKADTYALGDDTRPVEAHDIRRAWATARRAMIANAVACALGSALWNGI